jgi:hypothetical protein
LTTQEVSPELFVGTWANCPYWPSDWHGDPPRPQEIYCTFRSDGTLELREVFESGNVSFDDDTTWELNAEKWILSQRKSDELIEKWDIIEITEKSLELEPGNAHSPGPWRAVSCSGPGW